MAARSAKRCNPAVTASAKHLAGKTPKVIVTACRHKPLTILNAIARGGVDRTASPTAKTKANANAGA